MSTGGPPTTEPPVWGPPAGAAPGWGRPGWTPPGPVGRYGPPPYPYGPPHRHHRRGIRRWWVFWQSPDDQPRWARPVLLLVAALAALAYAWGLDNAALEPFYGAAARSMSMSWHNFFFAAFDPDGTVTVDKLPGALWIQALSLRAFGVNTWAFVMPQVVEGILTVLVLYRAVRRLAGPVAGIVAALVLAASPATVLLNRGNISDSLLILLLVLAADATAKAITTGRLRSLLLAGVWVGLAFQAKMTQAWLVLPALWLATVVAAPGRGGRRVGHVVLATVVTAVVSLSWMLAVTAVPQHERPYVDGSRNDSVFSQVFDYNGVARFEHPSAGETSVGPLASFIEVGLEERTFLNASTASIGRGWDRLLHGPLGRDTAWLIPASLLAALAVLVTRRRRARTDPIRAGTILWTGWLLLTMAAFSAGSYLNSYYTAALSPAIAALCGIGLAAAWRTVRARAPADPAAFDEPTAGFGPTGFEATTGFDPATGDADAPGDGSGGLPPWTVPLLVGVAVTVSAGYAVSLVPSGPSAPGWLVPAVAAAAVVTDALLVLSVVGRGRVGGVGALALAVAALALLLAPSVASGTVVADRLGPFDTPFQPASVTVITRTDVRASQDRAAAVDRELEAFARRTRTRMLFMTDTSAVASVYILESGREVLPIGGFTGAIPSPTLRQIKIDIAFGVVRLAIVPVVPPGTDPRIAWIRTHCVQIRIDPPAAIRFGVYDCHNVA
jgi:4-amino-4-deoxy-L-arabinose transferase-like glycosyltransferase